MDQELKFNPDLVIDDVPSLEIISIAAEDYKYQAKKQPNSIIAEVIEQWIVCDGNVALTAKITGFSIGSVSAWTSKYYINSRHDKDRIILKIESKL